MAATLPSACHQSSEYHNDGYAVQRSRRQWNIQDGPRGVIRRMRSQLAEEGDPDSQMALASALLQETDDDGECARQAVYWLTKASLQGHVKATELLQQCLDTAVGISEHNYHEVLHCLATPLQEKLARKAAHDLFLSISNGNDFVTSSMLAAHIRHLQRPTHELSEVSSEASTLEHKYGGERFLEEHLAAAAASYCQGHLPTLHQFLPSLSLCQERSKERDTRPASSPSAPGSRDEETRPSLWQRLFESRLLGLQSSDETAACVSGASRALEKLVQFLGVEVMKKIRCWSYSMTYIKLSFLVIFIASFCSSIQRDSLARCLPPVMFFASLMSMMVSSATIFANYKFLDQFKVWSFLLKHHCSALCTDSAERKFRNRWHLPFIILFISLICFLISAPLVPNLLLSICLPVFGLMCLLSLECSFKRVDFVEHLPLVLFLVAQGANFNYLADDLSQYLPASVGVYFDLLRHWEAEYVLTETIHLNLSLASMCHMTAILWYIICCVKKGWLAFSTLMLSVIWSNLFLACLKSVYSPINLAYCSIIWSLLIFAPLIFSFVSSAAPAAALFFLGQYLAVRFDFLLAVIITFVILQQILEKYFPRTLKILKLIITCSVVIFFFGNTHLPASKEEIVHLNWNDYRNICVPSGNLEAETWIACQPLEGLKVRWSGEVVDVKVTDVTNWPQFFLTILPLPERVRKFIVCNIGQELTPCNRSNMKFLDYERCILIAQIRGKDRCSVANWDVYSFSLTLAMDSANWKLNKEGMMIQVDFKNFSPNSILSLGVSERVEFEGMLTEGVGSKSLRVKGTKLLRTADKSHEPEISRQRQQHEVSYFIAAMSSIFDFFLKPTVVLPLFNTGREHV
ncbi:wolframin-like isoform X1 [Hyalella azteca]|uniref:Wolframin-like isoform X1 n=1 Tax=Hyalella azteca TaxID=294128 RepID=A0A8B7NTS1_HYAAZ|nr:wolframin-like isoform X1 [Hyalella azteca]